MKEPLTAAKRSALIQYKKNPIRKKSGFLARSKEKKSTAGKALCKYILDETHLLN